MVRTLLLESSVPSRFWCEALSTSVHLINRLPSPTLNHTSPLFRMYGHSPSYSDLRTFGCVCFVHLPAHERHKLTAQSVKCAFLGYDVSQKGYVCYDPHGQRIRISRNVVFLENQYFFPSHVEPPSISLSSLPSFSNSPSIGLRFKPGLVYARCNRMSGIVPYAPPRDPDPTPDLSTAPISLRRSTHLSRPPDRFCFSSSVSLVATLSTISIPSCYK